MKWSQNCAFFGGLLGILTWLTVTGCSTSRPYQETRSGNYLYLNPFAYKPATSQEHWEYAQLLRERGHLKCARKQFEILVKRWPDSAEAPHAKQATAELYFEQGKNKKAFTAYEEVIQEYYTEIQDYDSILDRQYTIATNEMNRKRMRWLFGGYRSPERAIPLFESIIQNAPQWERAPEMQYRIGQAYQKNDEPDLAVVAYSTVEYRYPNSPFAEQAAVAKIESFKELVGSTPYSLDIREQAQLSADLFPDLYTNSQHRAEAQAFSAELRQLSNRFNDEIGRFYERVPRPPQTNAAAIYYRKAIGNNGGGVPSVPSAEAETNGIHAEIQPLPQRLTTDDEAVEVTADRMEYSGNQLIGDGRVTLQQKGASLQADHVIVDSKTGEIKAHGNILMLREGNRWEGQELMYNYKTREGTFGKSFMYFDPAYITADRIERVSTNEFLMSNARITTCSGENPTVYAEAKEVRVLNEEKPKGAFIKAKHVTFYVGPVPVFYTPYWQRHIASGVFNTVVGYGGNFGAFMKVRATLHPTEWLTSQTHFDLYSKRGLGLGQDFAWETPLGGGKIKTYSIHDNDPYNKHDPKAYRNLIDPQRHRIKLTDREQLDDETYLATQLNWLSDPALTRDFFNAEYKNEANPENYAVLQRSSEDYAASLRLDRRMNDFYTTVNRLPEATYDWYRSQLGDSPFYFQSENNGSYLDQLHSATNFPQLRDYHSARFDTHNQLFLPLRYSDFFNVIPRVGYRGTAYNHTTTNATGSSDYRQLFELGTLTSFKAYRTLTDKNGFYGNGLRHIAEPYADYSWRAQPTLQPTDLPQFDPVDALDQQNEIRFGTRNFLQTKRGAKRIANVLNSDVYTTYRLDPSIHQRPFSNLVADAEMSLTDNLFVQSDIEYNAYTHKLTPANARLTCLTDDQSQYSFEYRYLDNTRELFTPRAVLFPNEKWSYEGSVSYDRTYEQWYERKILVTHKFDCLGMGLGFKINQYDETQLWVQLWLLAFPHEFMDTGF